MANFIPISGLNELATVSQDDFMPFVDSASMTTYRGTVSTLKNFFAASGSVLSSSWSSASISSSHAIQSDTASYLYPRLYEMTSSWTENVVWTTVVGTASLAYNAHTASRLEGIGSSYEKVFDVYSSLTTADGAYIQLAKRATVTSTPSNLLSVKTNSLFLNKDYVPGGTDGYGKIYYIDNSSLGKMVFEVGDTYTQVDNIGPNVDLAQQSGRGFLFQTNEAGNVSLGMNTGSLLFISSSGRVYGRIFEAQEFSSSRATTGGVGFFGTASYAMMSDYASGTTNVVPTGMIVGYAGSVAPSGWLNCDGTVYNPATYPALAALIGTNYGPGLTINEYCHPETVTTYANANDGWVRISWVSGGSGVFSISWGAGTYYINATTATSVTFTGLSGPANINYTFTDYGVSPAASYPRTVYVGYGGGDTSTNVNLVGGTYRLPQLSSNYFVVYANISPLLWIIKT